MSVGYGVELGREGRFIPNELGPTLPEAGAPNGERQLALVLWNGNVGGAEILNAELAEQMRRLGVGVTVVFVTHTQPLGERLLRAKVPYRSLKLDRGRDILRHPRLYAEEIKRCGPHGALVVERGFMGATLRAGGYREPIVAVEHGDSLHEWRVSRRRRLSRRLGRVAGAWTVDAEVAVSDFMLELMLRDSHANRTIRIHNGIDPEKYLPISSSPADHCPHTTVGFAARLIPGKGADRLIQALSQMSVRKRVRLLIAGDGPERAHLVSLAKKVAAESQIEFVGVVDDVPSFWRRCDIAALPGDTFVESFSMATLEAMACGKPVVASRSGAIPELIIDGVNGTLVKAGNVTELSQALSAYVEEPELRRRHGAAARARAIGRFPITATAQAYIDLFDELAASRDRTV
ncbi:MAG TPA: glycosyltransferase family 4 protein [Solirubrobacteraceae bacterium]|nr:glycosyltransferase family 4 protein [Solirubrobacteraceae bacterium]